MMPSADFQACLEGPHLARDDDAKGKVRERLERAAQKLQQAEEKAGGKESLEATVLSYQAMYACAQALVGGEGYRAASMTGLFAALQRLYVRAGRLDAGVVERMADAQRVAEGTQAHLQHARQLLDRSTALLGADTRG